MSNPYVYPKTGGTATQSYLSSLTPGQATGRSQLQVGLKSKQLGYENWMGVGEDTSLGLNTDANSYLANSAHNDATQTIDLGGGGGGGTDAFSMESMFGGENGGGWVNGITSIGTALVNGYLGYKSLGVAQETLAHQKKMDVANYNNQVASVNQGNTSHYLARVARSGKDTYQGKTQEQYEEDTHIAKMS